LLQLETEGLVTFHPHRGAKVRTLTTDQIDEIYRLRALLECYALEISIPAMTADGVATLRELAEELDKQAPGNEFVDIRVRFYRELYDAKRNPLLVQVIEELRSRVGRYLLSFRFDSAHDHEHGELVRFIANGDVPGAQQWMKGHLEGVRRGIEGLAGGYDAQPEVGGGSPKKRVTKTRSHPATPPSSAATGLSALSKIRHSE
jgi:DNA-binding GntR family transcriptional regulator